MLLDRGIEKFANTLVEWSLFCLLHFIIRLLEYNLLLFYLSIVL
jgi:hypothetical protein